MLREILQSIVSGYLLAYLYICWLHFICIPYLILNGFISLFLDYHCMLLFLNYISGLYIGTFNCLLLYIWYLLYIWLFINLLMYLVYMLMRFQSSEWRLHCFWSAWSWPACCWPTPTTNTMTESFRKRCVKKGCLTTRRVSVNVTRSVTCRQWSSAGKEDLSSTLIPTGDICLRSVLSNCPNQNYVFRSLAMQ